MAKVRTFSRKFPAGHPKAGKDTNFVEKFLFSVGLEALTDQQFKDCEQIVCGAELGLLPEMIELFDPKHHTLRAGNHFKKGDYFSPRVWEGAPYRSKQVALHPDLLIANVWDIKLDLCKEEEFLDVVYLNGDLVTGSSYLIEKLAKNDGLSVEDFRAWFNKPFEGQIICWNPEIKY